MTKPRSLGLTGLEHLHYAVVWQRNVKLHLSPRVFGSQDVSGLGFTGL